LDARLTTLLCKKIIVPKSKEVNTGWSNSQQWINLAETPKGGCGLKGTVLSMMMLMMIMIMMLGRLMNME
jgi:hypothetical protein